MKLTFSDYLKRGFALIVMLILGWLSFTVSENGFHQIEKLRQLERLPKINIASILTGETHIQGWANSNHPLVESSYTKTPSLYFYYLKEKRCKKGDSESWCTVDRQSRHIPFYLMDHSANIDVIPSGSVEWIAPRRFQQRSGDYRYSEWRIEPQDNVTVFGWAQKHQQNYQIVFNQPGQYSPIIATENSDEIRTTSGTVALGYLWGGISLLAGAGLALVYALGIHRVLVFVVLMALVMAVVLTNNGIKMLQQDLKNSEARAQQVQGYAQQDIQELLRLYDIQWQGWQAPEQLQHALASISAEHEQTIKHKLQNVAAALNQIQQQQNLFPANMFYWFNPSNAKAALQSIQALAGISDTDLPPLPKTRIAHLWGWLFCLLVTAVALITAFFGLKRIRFKRFLENVPTSDVAGMLMGLTEVKGKVLKTIDGGSLEAPLSHQQCVWYHYRVEERRGSGKNARWVTITDENLFRDFLLEDSSGITPVRFDGADISTQHSKSRRKGNRRYRVEWLEINDTCYVIGDCRVSTLDGHELEIADTTSDQPFIISNYSEQQLLVRKAFGGMLFLTLAFSASVASGLFLFASTGGFAITDFFAAAVAPATLMMAIILIVHYNDLIYLKKRVERNEANIDVALEKRFDSINSLIPVVKKHLNHEQALLEQVVSLRQKNQHTQHNTEALESYLQQERQLQRQYKAVLEQYPQLQSNSVIEQFSQSLTKLENDLAYARSAYNDAVEIYNSRINTFPDNMLAKQLKLTKKRWLRF